MVRVLNVIAGVAVLTRVSNYTLRPGETGIIFRKFGKSPEEPVREGTHFLIPWIEEIRVVDMTGRPQTITLQCFLQHLQSVTVTVSILYRPDVTALVGMSKKLGFDYYTEMMKSITFEKVHSVISQSTAGELSNNLSCISHLIFETLSKRAKEKGIILENFSIVKFEFSTPYSNMIEEYHVQLHETSASCGKAKEADEIIKADETWAAWWLGFMKPMKN